MESNTPELIDVIFVPVGGTITAVNSWCDLVELVAVEINVSEELDCEHCAAKIFRDPETFRCTFCCCNYNRIDGKSIIFKEKKDVD